MKKHSYLFIDIHNLPEAMTIAKSFSLCKNSSMTNASVIPIPAGNDSLNAAAIAILKV